MFGSVPYAGMVRFLGSTCVDAANNLDIASFIAATGRCIKESVGRSIVINNNGISTQYQYPTDCVGRPQFINDVSPSKCKFNELVKQNQTYVAVGNSNVPAPTVTPPTTGN